MSIGPACCTAASKMSVQYGNFMQHLSTIHMVFTEDLKPWLEGRSRRFFFWAVFFWGRSRVSQRFAKVFRSGSIGARILCPKPRKWAEQSRPGKGHWPMPLKAAASMRQSASGFKSGCTNFNQWTGAGKIYRKPWIFLRHNGGVQHVTVSSPSTSIDGTNFTHFTYQILWTSALPLSVWNSPPSTGHQTRGTKSPRTVAPNFATREFAARRNLENRNQGQSLSENRLACPQNSYLYLFM